MHSIEHYLTMAAQADEAAARAHSVIAKQCWRTIAETYRMLAAEKAQPGQAQRNPKSAS